MENISSRVNNHLINSFLFTLVIVLLNSIAGVAKSLDSNPIISNLLPMRGQAGSLLTISGLNFSGVTSVLFPSALSADSVATTPDFVNDTTIIVQIPLDIVSGLISIKGSSGLASSYQDFTYEKRTQTISGLGENGAIYTYGNPSLTITGTNSGIPVSLSFKSSPTKGIVSIIGNTFALIGVGTATITGAQASNQNYEEVSSSRVIAVLPKELVLKTDSASRLYNTPNPVFTCTLTGLVKNETLNVQYLCAANISSSVGNYIISATITGKTVNNYTITAKYGVLTILRSPQTINIPLVQGFELTPSSTLLTIRNITASSGLPVDLKINGKANLEAFSNGVAVISFDSAGPVSLVGNQSGNGNYFSALETVRNFTVSSKLLVENTLTGIAAEKESSFKVYPNPSNGLFWVESDEMSKLTIYAYDGKLVDQKTVASFNKQSLYLENKGYYIAVVQSTTGIRFLKLVVE